MRSYNNGPWIHNIWVSIKFQEDNWTLKEMNLVNFPNYMNTSMLSTQNESNKLNLMPLIDLI